ncbi:4-hydroxybenzoate 3-monooxygenase [Cryptosporangium aurantiacum]|uniref:p-hydroxybenzoate 3-monooxygenase n=1 Tax=Cryptosporangium aurantiacum TaxID=134849 RepID=A0A1M7QSH7_9ACTN|nr:4-hydroxybenzoate 3-monooxygenase [Cryptosporangium aurantiacum]SHN34612.1 p-hydroxybenzoate 3-monooxygenase [Cryptosporangium aurantiacum]
MRTRTQVGIIGAGPAGLLLQHLLAQQGVDSVLVENRSREYCEKRQRAGVLEHGSVELLKEIGLGDRMVREGLTHSGIYLQFDGERHHIDFPSLTGGRTLTVYAQTEVVKDLIAAGLAAGHQLHFEVSETAVRDIDTERPVLSFVDADGVAHEVECDAIAGCDGFHGVSRPAIPSLRVSERTYPFAWLGILATVPPSTDELIYAHSPHGFAMHSMRSTEVSRLYIQVDPDEKIEDWSDERIWEQLQLRLGHPGWTLSEGPITEKSITPMRSFVAEPMRHGRLFLAGDAAHIVPPTGAKGLNLAVADVKVLANALVRLLVEGKADLADAYSETCLTRVWRSTWFSWFMTSMLHRFPVESFASPAEAEFQERLQIAQLRQVVSSTAAATNLAENYAGWPLP